MIMVTTLRVFILIDLTPFLSIMVMFKESSWNLKLYLTHRKIFHLNLTLHLFFPPPFSHCHLDSYDTPESVQIEELNCVVARSV